MLFTDAWKRLCDGCMQFTWLQEGERGKRVRSVSSKQEVERKKKKDKDENHV